MVVLDCIAGIVLFASIAVLLFFLIDRYFI